MLKDIKGSEVLIRIKTQQINNFIAYIFVINRILIFSFKYERVTQNRRNYTEKCETFHKNTTT